MNPLTTASVYEKLAHIESAVHALLLGAEFMVPELPARDIPVLWAIHHPDKKPLMTAEGQARLMHDLASIELQAMELGLRSLVEFPEADRFFREELAQIVIGEARHLRLCLDAINNLGFEWGHWPVHTGLWQATEASDTLLDRLLIVHRYLEGAGLDAGESMMRKLSGLKAPLCKSILQTITSEEVDHVAFGSRWYRTECMRSGLEAGDDFGPRMRSLHARLPRRMEPLARELRYRAGFAEAELTTLLELREIKYSAPLRN